MKKCLVLYLFCIPIFLFAEQKNNFHNRVVHFAPIANSAVSSALSRSDLAYVRASLFQPHLNGSVGEVAANVVTFNSLRQKGGWRIISPRNAPQGLDNMFIKFDEKMRPRDLLIGETKYGTSKLGNTKDGVQFGNKWRMVRLDKMGDRYINLSEIKDLVIGKSPTLSSKNVMEIPLSNRRKVVFWKEGKSWFFSGKKNEILEAQNICGKIGKYLKSTASGKISYRSRLFHVYKTDNNVLIDVYKWSNLSENLDYGKMKPSAKMSLPLDKFNNSRNLSRSIASFVKSQHPMFSDELCHSYGRDLAKDVKSLLTKPQNFHLRTAKISAGSGLLAGGIVLISQALSSEQINMSEVITVGGLTFVSVEGAQYAALGLQRFSNISAPMRPLSTGMVGGALASLVVPYGMYLAGYSDLQTANISAVAGLGGTAIAGVASYGMFSLISACCVSSTGTAISTLSGAAATNATLAWLGGGSVAAGGGGVALGSVVATGGAAVIAIVATYGIIKCIEWKNERDRYYARNAIYDYYRNDDNALLTAVDNNFNMRLIQ